MRMRPKKNRVPRLEKVDIRFAAVTEDGKLDLIKTYLKPEQPLYVEIGCGKGSFITELSRRVENANLLALEKVPDVILLAMEKAEREECSDSLRFLIADAENLTALLQPASVDRLYLNFCDPWPKKRNAKRRLTSEAFLARYREILKPGARIFFKTDNRPLFDYSLETFPKAGYTLENVCFDLHGSAMNADNIETEYEKNFSAKGFSINYLEAFLK